MKPNIDVAYVAALARIEIGEAEKSSLQKDMEEILEYVGLLSEKDLSGIEATAHAVEQNNIYRQDIVSESFPRDIMLSTAPEIALDELIKVPQVIPGEEES